MKAVCFSHRADHASVQIPDEEEEVLRGLGPRRQGKLLSVWTDRDVSHTAGKDAVLQLDATLYFRAVVKNDTHFAEGVRMMRGHDEPDHCQGEHY